MSTCDCKKQDGWANCCMRKLAEEKLAARDAEIAQLKLVASFPQSKVEQELKAKCERMREALEKICVMTSAETMRRPVYITAREALKEPS